MLVAAGIHRILITIGILIGVTDRSQTLHPFELN